MFPTVLRVVVRRYFRPSAPRELLQLASLSVACWLGKQSIRNRGITLIALPPYQVDSLAQVVAALDLLEQTDIRRYRRVQRFVRRIVLCDSGLQAFYCTIGRICGVTKTPLAGKNADRLAVYRYATLLVHEATHGLLEVRVHRCSSRLSEKVESICIAEHKRYARKLPPKEDLREEQRRHGVRA